MRLGEKRRICIRNSAVKKRKFSLGLLVLLFITLLFGGSVYFLKIVRPVMIELAISEVTTQAELAIHRVVGQMFKDIDSRELVKITQLSDGTVSSISSDMSRVNELKATASIAISEEIASLGQIDIAIPIGTLTGYELAAGIGPRMPIQLMPYGSVTIGFQTDFTETGINQTLLSVNLTAKASVGIVIPSATMTEDVITDIPITQTVIVGKIPDNYVNIGELGENYESDMLDIVG